MACNALKKLVMNGTLEKIGKEASFFVVCGLPYVNLPGVDYLKKLYMGNKLM